MNNKEITSIALKVFAIYILIQGLVSMPSLLRGFVYYSELEVANHLDTYALAWAISIPSVLAIFVLSFVIWKMSNNIGLKLSEKKAQSEYTVTQEFLLGLLGIYLLTEALVNLTFMLSDHYFTGLKPEYFSDKVEANETPGHPSLT